MMRRLTACLLLVLLPLLGACSEPKVVSTESATLVGGLKWTGTEITGAEYTFRRTKRATVHYALPTMPDVAEFIAQRVEAYYEKQEKFGRVPPVPHAQVWLVPPGYEWPKGAPDPDPRTVAVAPGVIIFRDDQLISAIPIGMSGVFRPLDYWLGAAIYEPAGSPAYAQAWLQNGMGMIWTQAWGRFPQEFVLWGSARELTGRELLEKATADGEYLNDARIALSGLLLERFGVNWSRHYLGDPADLTPEAALKWAMGTDDLNTALERLATRFAADNRYTLSRADVNPGRMSPALPQLPPGPGPNPNDSPQAYELDLALDPAQGTIAGEVRLTWQNGEGIPLDALYFHLWPNAERYRMYGGNTTVANVTVDGQPAGFTAQGIDLKVDLGRTVAPGGQVVVAIQFSTRLTANLNLRLGLVGGQRFALSLFYPTLAVLDDRGWNLHALHSSGGDPYAEHADYQVRLTVPAGFVVGATGTLMERTEHGSTWTYRYAARQAPQWGAVGGMSWAESEVMVGTTRVRLLDSDANWRQAITPAVVETLSFLERELGAFPLPEVVVVKISQAQGTVKLPGIASTTEADHLGWFRNNLANSLAGQWFGTYVGNDQWTEAWLDEGLSRYMERRTARATGSENTVPRIRQSDRPQDATVTQNGMDFVLTGGNIDQMAGDYAALFFEALEAKIGSEAMTDLLRRWVREFGGQTGTGSDFIRLAEATAGPLGLLMDEHGVDPGERVPYRPIPVPVYDQ